MATLSIKEQEDASLNGNFKFFICVIWFPEIMQVESMSTLSFWFLGSIDIILAYFVQM